MNLSAKMTSVPCASAMHVANLASSCKKGKCSANITLVIAFNAHGKLTAENELKHFAFITKQNGSASGSRAFDYEIAEPANFASPKCFFVIGPTITGGRGHTGTKPS